MTTPAIERMSSKRSSAQAIKDAAQTAGVRSTFGWPLLRNFVICQQSPEDLAAELEKTPRFKGRGAFSGPAGVPWP